MIFELKRMVIGFIVSSNVRMCAAASTRALHCQTLDAPNLLESYGIASSCFTHGAVPFSDYGLKINTTIRGNIPFPFQSDQTLFVCNIRCRFNRLEHRNALFLETIQKRGKRKEEAHALRKIIAWIVFTKSRQSDSMPNYSSKVFLGQKGRNCLLAGWKT